VTAFLYTITYGAVDKVGGRRSTGYFTASIPQSRSLDQDMDEILAVINQCVIGKGVMLDPEIHVLYWMRQETTVEEKTS
jgi:hypothetical protein